MLEILGPAQWLPLSQTTSSILMMQSAEDWRGANGCAYRKLHPAGARRRIGRCSVVWPSCSNSSGRSSPGCSDRAPRGKPRSPPCAISSTCCIGNHRSGRHVIPPAKPGALGCEPLIAAAGVADATPISFGRLKAAARRHRHRFNCSRRASSSSWLRIYSRITSSSRPTVETKYPRAQKCCPTKLRFRSA